MGSEYDGKIQCGFSPCEESPGWHKVGTACTRSTGEPGDQECTYRPDEDDRQGQPDDSQVPPRHSQGESDEKITGGNSSAPTNYEPDSDSCAPHSRWLYAG